MTVHMRKRGWGCVLFMLLFCCFIGSIAVIIWLRLPTPPELPPEVATSKVPAISPSGNYELQVIKVESAEGFEMLKFQVKSINDGDVFISKDEFSARHTTFFLWDGNDHIWVYSGDLGTYYWSLSPGEFNWIKHDYGPNTPAPDFLKEIRPNYHPW